METAPADPLSRLTAVELSSVLEPPKLEVTPPFRFVAGVRFLTLVLSSSVNRGPSESESLSDIIRLEV